MSAAIGLVDYGMGNRRSVQKALERTGARVIVSSEPTELADLDGLVVPGVGAFPEAMRRLRALALDKLIRERAADGVPLLGICLGMQLLFERSEELEPTDGLKLIPGRVERLRAPGERVPHIGWSEVAFERPSPLTATLPKGGCPFYHVHSFAARPQRAADVVGTAEHGERFASIVQSANVFGVQFHPEKSSANGLRLLERFVALCADGARAHARVAAGRVAAGT